MASAAVLGTVAQIALALSVLYFMTGWWFLSYFAVIYIGYQLYIGLKSTKVEGKNPLF
jgi:hypothetical protein